jgi:hypothetical protein
MPLSAGAHLAIEPLSYPDRHILNLAAGEDDRTSRPHLFYLSVSAESFALIKKSEPLVSAFSVFVRFEDLTDVLLYDSVTRTERIPPSPAFEVTLNNERRAVCIAVEVRRLPLSSTVGNRRLRFGFMLNAAPGHIAWTDPLFILGRLRKSAKHRHTGAPNVPLPAPGALTPTSSATDADLAVAIDQLRARYKHFREQFTARHPPGTPMPTKVTAEQLRFPDPSLYAELVGPTRVNPRGPGLHNPPDSFFQQERVETGNSKLRALQIQIKISVPARFSSIFTMKKPAGKPSSASSAASASDAWSLPLDRRVMVAVVRYDFERLWVYTESKEDVPGYGALVDNGVIRRLQDLTAHPQSSEVSFSMKARDWPTSKSQGDRTYRIVVGLRIDATKTLIGWTDTFEMKSREGDVAASGANEDDDEDGEDDGEEGAASASTAAAASAASASSKKSTASKTLKKTGSNLDLLSAALASVVPVTASGSASAKAARSSMEEQDTAAAAAAQPKKRGRPRSVATSAAPLSGKKRRLSALESSPSEDAEAEDAELAAESGIGSEGRTGLPARAGRAKIRRFIDEEALAAAAAEAETLEKMLQLHGISEHGAVTGASAVSPGALAAAAITQRLATDDYDAGTAEEMDDSAQYQEAGEDDAQFEASTRSGRRGRKPAALSPMPAKRGRGRPRGRPSAASALERGQSTLRRGRRGSSASNIFGDVDFGAEEEHVDEEGAAAYGEGEYAGGYEGEYDQDEEGQHTGSGFFRRGGPGHIIARLMSRQSTSSSSYSSMGLPSVSLEAYSEYGAATAATGETGSRHGRESSIEDEAAAAAQTLRDRDRQFSRSTTSLSEASSLASLARVSSFEQLSHESAGTDSVHTLAQTSLDAALSRTIPIPLRASDSVGEYIEPVIARNEHEKQSADSAGGGGGGALAESRPFPGTTTLLPARMLSMPLWTAPGATSINPRYQQILASATQASTAPADAEPENPFESVAAEAAFSGPRRPICTFNMNPLTSRASLSSTSSFPIPNFGLGGSLPPLLHKAASSSGSSAASPRSARFQQQSVTAPASSLSHKDSAVDASVEAGGRSAAAALAFLASHAAALTTQ